MARLTRGGTLNVHRAGAMVTVELPADGMVDDGAELEAICSAIEDLINARRSPHLVLSFSHVQVISSIFLGRLFAFNQKVRERGGQFALINVSPQINEVFVLTRLSLQVPVNELPRKFHLPIGGWTTLAAVMLINGAIGLVCMGRILFQGMPVRGHLLPVFYFILTIPLAIGLFIARARWMRLSRRAQWIGTGLLAAISLVLLADLFLP